MSTASSYFPHMFNIKCSTNEMTPLEFFNNNVKFKHMLKKRLRNGYIKNISDSSIRIMTQVYSDTKSVTNFRPSAAAAIYTRYGGLDGVVWDMCAGFGGRLFGAMAAKNIQKYIGTEPSTKTYEGLTNIKNDFEQLSGKQIELHCVGSEDFIPEKESLNLCFTSPPYFDLELYSDESTQSYIKYPTYEEWLNGYMYKTINNCHYGLKKNGYLIINIKNIKHCMNLEQDINNLLIKKFEYIDTLQYCISGKPGKEINYEPVFVYKKFN